MADEVTDEAAADDVALEPPPAEANTVDFAEALLVRLIAPIATTVCFLTYRANALHAKESPNKSGSIERETVNIASTP